MTDGAGLPQPLGVLVLISAPGSSLNLDDHDIVTVLQASAFPGRAVIGATDGRYHFVYLTDATLDQCAELAGPWRADPTPDQIADPDADLDDVETLAKRRYRCTLTGGRASVCSTYRSLADAPADQKLTWVEFNSTYLSDKADG